MSIKNITDLAKVRFAEIAFPHKKDEYWRFADLNAWGVDGLFPFFSSSNPPVEEKCASVRLKEIELASSKILLSDGQLMSAEKIEGVDVIPMADAFNSYSDILEKFFSSASGKLDVFQASRAEYGVFVRVHENVEANIDIAIVSKMHISACGVFFLLDKNSKLRLDKTSLTFGGSLSSSRFGFELQEGAKLIYSQHKYSEKSALMFEREDFTLAENAEIVDAMSQEGLSHSRSERNFYLNGSRANVDSRVFLKTSGSITADLRTKQIHSVEGAKSNLAVKAALNDSSAIAFTGLVDVCEQAQKTEAYQSCRSLLLSKDAKAQASPILEISANDVMCSHGCTVAEPDKEQLFYMRSRGLTLEQAREMIVESFANSTFEKISQQS